MIPDEERAELREAWRDLAYAVVKAWGVIWLISGVSG